MHVSRCEICCPLLVAILDRSRDVHMLLSAIDRIPTGERMDGAKGAAQ